MSGDGLLAGRGPRQPGALGGRDRDSVDVCAAEVSLNSVVKVTFPFVDSASC